MNRYANIGHVVNRKNKVGKGKAANIFFRYNNDNVYGAAAATALLLQ